MLYTFHNSQPGYSLLKPNIALPFCQTIQLATDPKDKTD